MRHYVSPHADIYMTWQKSSALLIIWLYIKLIKWKIRKISTPLRLSCFIAPPLQLPSSHNHPSSLIFHPIIEILLKILFITIIKLKPPLQQLNGRRWNLGRKKKMDWWWRLREAKREFQYWKSEKKLSSSAYKFGYNRICFPPFHFQIRFLFFSFYLSRFSSSVSFLPVHVICRRQRLLEVRRPRSPSPSKPLTRRRRQSLNWFENLV